MSQTDLDALRVEFSERSKPLVFWTGAGLSVPVVPSWAGLRDILLGFLRERAKTLNATDQKTQLAEHVQIRSTSDIWLQFERLEKSIGRELFVQRIGSSGESVDGFRSRQGIRASMIGAYRCAFGE